MELENKDGDVDNEDVKLDELFVKKSILLIIILLLLSSWSLIWIGFVELSFVVDLFKNGSGFEFKSMFIYEDGLINDIGETDDDVAVNEPVDEEDDNDVQTNKLLGLILLLFSLFDGKPQTHTHMQC